MRNIKQWGVALVVLLALLGALAYQATNHKIGLAEAKSDIDPSILNPKNPGCSITGPDGASLDLSVSKTIPKGTFITGECFASRRP